MHFSKKMKNGFLKNRFFFVPEILVNFFQYNGIASPDPGMHIFSSTYPFLSFPFLSLFLLSFFRRRREGGAGERER